ncbi:V-set domain-containing T-cell activation inhibitor 1-like isoform X1 [Carassius gibelio]|uniref:V-set domain-containing T-cell activation inhibitor 1-like isoform X1 n=1 Tax=Carassius gibelio TaxID=101364 RepID=UPI002277EFE0|nr:V-set domain-containing T-cell activation inhibitor 1-like isoform X1 [Carassius gibelio]XP_052395382.1 V-set domain-containing T-cell activation inhibitor 1-like isoform X1 [Carassius gibelio]
MIIGHCFIIVFAVLINKVCLQVTVEGVIGGCVVLPCSSAQHDLKLQDIDVHWRDTNDKIVYSIIKGKQSLAGQDQRYKNRADTFPDEYQRGNFSLKLNNLQHTDAGKYTCFITPSDEQETAELILKAETGHNPSDQGNHGEDSGANSVGKSGPLLWVCILAIYYYYP